MKNEMSEKPDILTSGKLEPHTPTDFRDAGINQM